MRCSGLRCFSFHDLVEAAPLSAGGLVDVAATGSLVELVASATALFGFGVTVAEAAFACFPASGFTRYPLVTRILVIGEPAF